MSKNVRSLRCRLGRHQWGPVTGNGVGGQHRCERCGKQEHVDFAHPQAHEKEARLTLTRWR